MYVAAAARPHSRRRRLAWTATTVGFIAIALLLSMLHQTNPVHRRAVTGRVLAPSRPATALAPSTMPSQTSVGPDVSLVPFQGTQLPVSRTLGPTHLDADTASGFAPSVGGAAFAALHLSIRATSDVGPAVYRPTIEHQVAGDAATYLADVEASYASAAARNGVASGQPIQQSTAIAEGWRADESSLTQPVTIHLLLGSTGSPLLIDVPVTVLFDGGDWKLLPPPTGNFTGSPVASATGYTPYIS